MERMKRWISKWFLALLATMMVVMSLAGCNSGDAEKALDMAIEVLEVVESLDAEMAEEAGETEDRQAGWISESGSQSQQETNINEIAAERETTAKQENNKKRETIAKQETAEKSGTATGLEEHVTEDADQSLVDELTVEEDGHYTSKEEVALYLHVYGKLPSNFISKNEAEDLGWKKKQGEAGQLHVVAPGRSIGGSKFGNYEGLLPEKKGRQYYECDINYKKGNRGAERIVYSNDGLIFYTGDHYESFEQLYPAE